jgi:hypothetical protein
MKQDRRGTMGLSRISNSGRPEPCGSQSFLDLLHEVLAQRDAQQQLYRVSHK